MRRKQVLHRLKSLAEVQAALGAHREKIGRELDARLPAREGETFSYQSQFDHMSDELATIETKLIANEDAHVRQQVRITKLKQKDQGLTTDLYSKQISARRVLRGLYGPEHDFPLAATSGSTPRETQILKEQVDQTVKMLRNPEDPLPEVKIAGVAIDFPAMADDLEGTLATLRTTRVELGLKIKEADDTRAQTNAAIAEYNRVFPLVATNLETAFRLVGETELADRIRTSRQRVTRRQGDSDTDGRQQQEETTPADGSVETSPANDDTAPSTDDANPSPEAVESPEAAPAVPVGS